MPDPNDLLIRHALECRYKLRTRHIADTEMWIVEASSWEPTTLGSGPDPVSATKDWAAKNGVKWEVPQ